MSKTSDVLLIGLPAQAKLRGVVAELEAAEEIFVERQGSYETPRLKMLFFKPTGSVTFDVKSDTRFGFFHSSSISTDSA